MTPWASIRPTPASTSIASRYALVAAPDRDSGDEMMQDVVVENDDAWPPPQCVDDPPVRVDEVADVVEAISMPRGTRSDPRLGSAISIRSSNAGSRSAL